MLRRLGAQLGGLVLTLVLASIVIYASLALTPGDPVSTIIGGARPTPALLHQVRAAYHLNDPVWLRYLRWVGGILHGHLGQSFVYKSSIGALIRPRIGVTFELVAYAGVIVAVVGLGSGILAARSRRADRLVLIGSTIGLAMPTYIVAILLIWIFARTLGWFPVLGSGSGGLDTLRHLTLPAVSLAVVFIAYLSRITRGAVLGQLGAEHVETARMRGIPRLRTFRSHVLLNASPQILSISGMTFAGMFAAAAVVEQAFGLGGIGALLIDAAARKDLPVVQVVALLLVAIFVVVNAVTDIAVALIDPRTLRRRG